VPSNPTTLTAAQVAPDRCEHCHFASKSEGFRLLSPLSAVSCPRMGRSGKVPGGLCRGTPQSRTEVQHIVRVRNITVPCRNGAFFASILKRTVGLRHDEKMGSGTLPPALNGSFSCFFDPFLGPRLQNLESKIWDKYLRLLALQPTVCLGEQIPVFCRSYICGDGKNEDSKEKSTAKWSAIKRRTREILE